MKIAPHCPLCIPKLSTLGPNTAFICLDMDKVLSDRDSPSDTMDQIIETRKKLFGKSSELTLLQYRIADAKHLIPEALENLHTLIEKVEKIRPVAILLTSQWRNDATLSELIKKVFVDHRFARYIVGKTPPENGDKWAPEIKAGHRFETHAKEKYGYKNFICSCWEQIHYWLMEHHRAYSDFVVLDDQTFDFQEKCPHRFVKVEGYWLSKKEADKAYQIMTKEEDLHSNTLPLGHAIL